MSTWGLVTQAAARPAALLLLTCVSAAVCAAGDTYTYSDGHGEFVYSVTVTGENHSFEFQKNPGKQEERLKAAVHVLKTVYADGSIKPRHSSFFTKEGAKCFVFDSTFYTYTSCFLPNDYSPGNQDRFWGFVTRVPNALWLLTRNLLPAVLILGGFAFLMLRKGSASGGHTDADHPALKG